MNPQEKFVKFSFSKITTYINKNGEEKKKMCSPPEWKNITKDNYKEYLNPKDKAFATITGEMSGITVFDFDKIELYNKLVSEHPEMKNMRTIQTKNGVHIYCSYEKEILTTTDKETGLDVRNDDAIVFCAPTSYVLQNKDLAVYKDLGGDILPAPSYLKQLLKQYKIKETTKMSKTKKQPTNAGVKVVSKDSNKISELLGLLDPNKLSRSEWLNVTIVCADLTGEAGLKDYLKWDSTYSGVDIESDSKTYMSFVGKQNTVSIGSLHFLAKKHNIEGYNLLFPKDIFNFKEPLSSGAISDYFKETVDSFVYVKGQLYNFNGVYWEKDDENHSKLHNFLDNNLFKTFIKQSYVFQEKNIDDPEICKKMSKIMLGLSSLRHFSSRKPFVSDIICKITDSTIKFDEKPYLFAFKNKVYDFQKMTFVEPNPLDYISMTTDYDYDDNYDLKKVESLNTLIQTIHSNKNIRDYHLSALSTGMIGLHQQKFFVATGSGGNGKGLLHGLMLKTLGSYGYILTNTVLTNNMKQGSNPELANCHNKRFVLTSEPDASSTLKTSVLKVITGGSEINARLNHSNDCEILLKCSLFCECNKLVYFDEVCEAILRRLETIPFNARFVDADKFDTEDKTISGIKNTAYETQEWKNDYKQALFMILSKYVPSFLEKGLVSPIEVLVENKKYLQDSDRIFSTISDLLVKTDDKKDDIKLKELYTSFTNTEYFKHLTKLQKRDSNYKKFVESLSTNMFLRKYVTEDKHKANILINHKFIVEEPEKCELDTEEICTNKLGFMKEVKEKDL
jgi:phage/plasmid-associated DNA primase